MILNMIGGTGPVTVVDFTLSEDIPVDSSTAMGPNVLTIDNVFLPGNTVNGFVIQSLDVPSNYGNNISHIYTDFYNDNGNIITRLRYVDFVPSSGVYHYESWYNPNSNAYVYDAIAKTLSVSVALSNAIMKAGNWRLIIW